MLSFLHQLDNLFYLKGEVRYSRDWLWWGTLDKHECVILIIRQHLYRSPFWGGGQNRQRMLMPHILRAVRFETRSFMGWNVRWDVKKFGVNVQFLILDDLGGVQTLTR